MIKASPRQIDNSFLSSWAEEGGGGGKAAAARCPCLLSFKTSQLSFCGAGASHHVGVLVLQLVQLFALLPQEQDPESREGGGVSGASGSQPARDLGLTHLCSLSVAWTSHTRTRERRFFISVQISDMYRLPMLWMSSCSRAA